MTRDEIADMARAVNLPYYPETGEIQNLDKLVWFARLVAATEREACAQVCEQERQKGYDDDADGALERVAAAIRARGMK